MGEFELIERFFVRPGSAPAGGVALGIGDDCALLEAAPGQQWAVSTDMLVAGRHFFADAEPRALGHKALAVNLSDLAACAAQPVAFTLALALPEVDTAWLQAFSEGLFELADAHACTLVGGDTTRGPLTLSITVWGQVPRGQALLRSGARAGDDVYVSGAVGPASLGLRALQHQLQLDEGTLAHCRARLERPTPRVALGLALRGVASAAADVSDGLAGDLGHILKRSGLGATLELALLEPALASLADAPVAASLRALPASVRQQALLAGGDDYELVFAAPPAQRNAVQAIATRVGVPLTRIGTIEPTAGLRLRAPDGTLQPHRARAFDHFASE